MKAEILKFFCCGFVRIQELEYIIKDRRNQPLTRGKVSPRLLVPDHIPKPPYVESGESPKISSEFQIHDSGEIVKMKAACKLAARVLAYAGTLVRVSKKRLALFFFFFFV